MTDLIKAFAYLRTSSATNVQKDGDDADYKDSDKRQFDVIQKFAGRAGYEIVGEPYYDADVKGADAVMARPAFAEMLERILSNGVRTIIVESASRFSRDLMTQEIGYKMLKDKGVTLIAADSPEMFLDNGPTATLIRQILGAVSQFEKDMLVLKLRGARQRKKAVTGKKVEGGRNHGELRPDVVSMAKALRAERKSLRDIAEILGEQGFYNERGDEYSAAAISRMLKCD